MVSLPLKHMEIDRFILSKSFKICTVVHTDFCMVPIGMANGYT